MSNKDIKNFNIAAIKQYFFRSGNKLLDLSSYNEFKVHIEQKVFDMITRENISSPEVANNILNQILGMKELLKDIEYCYRQATKD